MLKPIICAFAAIATLVCNPAYGQDKLENLARQLIQLRSQVESLHAELERKREGFRVEQRSLATQKAELEASLRRKELAVRQLEKTLAKQRQAAKAAGAASETLRPVVVRAIQDLAHQIATGLPFKQEQRLMALVDLKRSLQSGAIISQQAVNRLWGFYQDEYRLTGGTGIHTKSLNLKASNGWWTWSRWV